MADQKTAAEWTATAAEFRAQLAIVTAQQVTAAAEATRVNAELSTLREQGFVALAAGNRELFNTLRIQGNKLVTGVNTAKNEVERINKEKINLSNDASRADAAAAKAETGPPNTAVNTPPATTQPNTPPTAIPLIALQPPPTLVPNLLPLNLDNPVAYDSNGKLRPEFELDEDNTPVLVGDNAVTTTIFQPELVLPQSAFPVAYDDDSNLQPGYILNDETGQPAFIGFGGRETVTSPEPVLPQSAFPVAYDDDGNLQPGYELDGDGIAVFVGDNAVTTTTFQPGPLLPQSAFPFAYDDEDRLQPGYILNDQGQPAFIGFGGRETVTSPEPVLPQSAFPVAYDAAGNLQPGYELDGEGIAVFNGDNTVTTTTFFPKPLSADSFEAPIDIPTGAERNGDAGAEAETLRKAQEQATLQARYKQPSNSDWRVRLVLAEGADYLYKASLPGILAPLAQSEGVIFPYMPKIDTIYSAKYEKNELVHSNYRGYYYSNSSVGDISISGTFTAQDTQEAEYLLAVIHFFRSVTKMFYGQDAQRGAPPPIVYLIGLGDYQFSGHPCVVSSFNYTLPNDVDYIRAYSYNNYGTNMFNRRTSTASSSPVSAVLTRLSNAIDKFGQALQPGAENSKMPPAIGPLASVNNLNRATYVPTKMEIAITLLPIQTRDQVSKRFSLKDFAHGKLLQEGFW